MQYERRWNEKCKKGKMKVFVTPKHNRNTCFYLKNNIFKKVESDFWKGITEQQKVRVSFTIREKELALSWGCSRLNLCATKGKVIGEPYFQFQFLDHSRKIFFLSTVLIMKITGNDSCGGKKCILSIKMLYYQCGQKLLCSYLFELT